MAEIRFTVDEFISGHRSALMLTLECYRREVESYEVALANVKATIKAAKDTVATLKLYNVIDTETAQEILTNIKPLNEFALRSLDATECIRNI